MVKSLARSCSITYATITSLHLLYSSACIIAMRCPVSLSKYLSLDCSNILLGKSYSILLNFNLFLICLEYFDFRFISYQSMPCLPHEISNLFRWRSSQDGTGVRLLALLAPLNAFFFIFNRGGSGRWYRGNLPACAAQWQAGLRIAFGIHIHFLCVPCVLAVNNP